jgi:hypothetical protein
MDDNDQPSERAVVSDGKTEREIWRPEDGNGDPNIKTYEETQYDAKGHPTWKLYCGDAPENIEGVLIEPPKNCYLDDRAAYKILNWDGYTKAERGRFWRNDFSNKGDIRPHRKHRGRPAFLLGGEIAALQGGARVYRFSGAIHPNDIATVDEELLAQKENKALARLMPSTNIPRAKSPIRQGAGASKQLKRLSKSSSPTNTSEDPAEFEREPSPFTAILEDPTYSNPSKRPRLNPNRRSTPSKSQPINPTLIADLRNQNLALTERNDALSTKVRDLTRDNGYLQAELTSTKTLWSATSKELTTLRAQYRDSQTALREQDDGSVNIAGLQAVKNDLTIYRNLAKQLFSKLQGSAETLEKGVIAVNGVKNLAKELGVVPKDEVGMEKELSGIQKDLNLIREKMKAVLGDEWARFEKEAFEERDG